MWILTPLSVATAGVQKWNGQLLPWRVWKGKKKATTPAAVTLNQVKMIQLAEDGTGRAAAATWQFDSRASWQVDEQSVYVRVKDSSAGHGSVMEEKWLVKELLLLQYHVAPQQSRPVRDIHQAGSSLPGVLRSFSTAAQLHVAIYRSDTVLCIVGLLITSCQMSLAQEKHSVYSASATDFLILSYYSRAWQGCKAFSVNVVEHCGVWDVTVGQWELLLYLSDPYLLNQWRRQIILLMKAFCIPVTGRAVNLFHVGIQYITQANQDLKSCLFFFFLSLVLQYDSIGDDLSC